MPSRTPRWVRGLKSCKVAWYSAYFLVAPHDGCVDWNPEFVRTFHSHEGRTPRWVRGLKFYVMYFNITIVMSHPTMGAWIEILWQLIIALGWTVAPHDGCVDWNLGCGISILSANQSHPTMGAWIEIPPHRLVWTAFFVAPHDGCVDWNIILIVKFDKIIRRTPRWVRGLKLSMIYCRDYTQCRTPRWVRGLKSSRVGLDGLYLLSHPTMGAWIEI